MLFAGFTLTIVRFLDSALRAALEMTKSMAGWQKEGVAWRGAWGGIKRKIPTQIVSESGSRRTAATYSPTWYSSTIGASELNFSVRNGKRWILTAITTAMYCN